MQMQPPSTNGNHTAPHSARGAVSVPAPSVNQRPPTTFPAALPHGGGDEWLYTVGRGTLAGLPLQRVVMLGVALVALTWALRPLPGGGWVAGGLLLGLVGVALARAAAARRAFVHFAAHAGDLQVAPERLPVSDKLPVYLWGDLEVQARVRSFVALPAFYRTFATREHALIGRVDSVAHMGVARIPDYDEGLWYAFCTPAQVVSVRAGTLHWGRRRYPALALERHTARTQESGRMRAGVETLYIGALDQATVERIWADLAVEQKVQAGAVARPV